LHFRYPTIRPFILGVVEGDPAIFSASLNFQLEELVRRPVTASHTVLHDSICCVVVDGIDECGSDENQTEVIPLLQDLSSDPDLPFRVVVSFDPNFLFDSHWADPCPTSLVISS
jgi:hypothetical protein